MTDGAWVLIVDDDEDIRDTIQSLLQLKGYRVQSAASGEEGLQRMRAGSLPSLVILDFMMPGMNGNDFRTAQLADPLLADVPVVLLTGAGDVSACRTERISKPVDLQVLFDMVRRFCESR